MLAVEQFTQNVLWFAYHYFWKHFEATIIPKNRENIALTLGIIATVTTVANVTLDSTKHKTKPNQTKQDTMNCMTMDKNETENISIYCDAFHVLGGKARDCIPSTKRKSYFGCYCCC